MREWRRLIGERFEAAGHRVDIDVVEELAQHAAAAWTTARAEGLETGEADARVRTLIDAWVRDGSALRHGSPRRQAVAPPDGQASSLLADLVQDVRYAGRLFRRKPGFVALMLVTMALGIAATTTLFSVAYGVLMKPLPWDEPERLVILKETRAGRQARFGAVSNASYLAWRDDPATIEGIGAWAPRFFTLTGAGDPERIRVMAATASLFDVLRVKPLIGTGFSADDETAGGVVVLSEPLWRQRFGADPSVLGRTIHLDGQGHRVVGVIPHDAAYPAPDVRAWVPFLVPSPTGNMLSMFDSVNNDWGWS